jgi:hypothetical protein
MATGMIDRKAGMTAGMTGIGIGKVPKRTGKEDNLLVMIGSQKTGTLLMIVEETGSQDMVVKGMTMKGLMVEAGVKL